MGRLSGKVIPRGRVRKQRSEEGYIADTQSSDEDLPLWVIEFNALGSPWRNHVKYVTEQTSEVRKLRYLSIDFCPS